jgi:hypothetical protein
MRKWMLSTNELLGLAGLQKRNSFLEKALPIAAGVGAGLVAGIGVTFALLTPARRDKLTQGARELWSRREKVDLFSSKPADVVHSDAPGTETSRTMNGRSSQAHA